MPISNPITSAGDLTGSTLALSFTGSPQSALIFAMEPPIGAHPPGTAAATVRPTSGKGIAAFTYTEGGATVGPMLTGLTLSDLKYCSGNFSPTNCTALATLDVAALCIVGGNFSPATMAALTTLTMTNLMYVGGACSPATMATLTTLSFPALTAVGGAMSPSSMALVTSLSAPNLTHVGGAFSPGTMAALTTFSVPNLQYVGGACSPTTMGALVTLSFPALAGVNGAFSPTTMGSLTTLSAPNLVTVGGAVGISTMASLTTLTLTNLTTVGGAFSPTTLGALATLSLPALATVTGNFSITAMASLTTLSLPALVTLGGTFGVAGTAVLANVTIGTTLKSVAATTVSFATQALTAASVDGILTAFAGLDGTNGTTLWGSGKTLTLTGGTNAAPTFTGTSFATTAMVVSGGNLCTVTKAAHGVSTGEFVTVSGSSGGGTSGTNGTFVATVVDANTFTYPMVGSNGAVAVQGTVKRTGSTTEGYYMFQKLAQRGVTVTTT